MEWISVKEKLPDSYNDVLVLEGDEYRIAWWDGGVWNAAYGPAVTHWMPIPALPDDGEE